MKAIVYSEYGLPDVLQLKEVEKPTPKGDEILIRIHTTSLTTPDVLVRSGRAVSLQDFTMPGPFQLITVMYFGLRKPRITILGAEFAGEVEAVGVYAKRFKEGDQVFGYLGQRMGANAEYTCMPESGIVAIKPTNMTFE